MISFHDILLPGPDEKTTYDSFSYNPGLPENKQMRRKLKNREIQRSRERSQYDDDDADQHETQEKWNWGSSKGGQRIF